MASSKTLLERVRKRKGEKKKRKKKKEKRKKKERKEKKKLPSNESCFNNINTFKQKTQIFLQVLLINFLQPHPFHLQQNYFLFSLEELSKESVVFFGRFFLVDFFFFLFQTNQKFLNKVIKRDKRKKEVFFCLSVYFPTFATSHHFSI